MKYLITGLFLIQSLLAVQLSPMTNEINTIKKRNVTYIVKNSDADMAAAECKILKVVGHEKSGKEIREETDEVVLYPTQFVLQPKETKGIRVNYTKSVLPKKEQVYRVLANQLALNLKEKPKGTKVKAGMKFIFSYEGLLFVGGEGEPQVHANIAGDQKDRLMVTIHNSGGKSSFVHPEHYIFTAVTDKGPVHLSKEALAKFSGVRLLPDESFTFTVDKIFALKDRVVRSITVQKREK